MTKLEFTPKERDIRQSELQTQIRNLEWKLLRLTIAEHKEEERTQHYISLLKLEQNILQENSRALVFLSASNPLFKTCRDAIERAKYRIAKYQSLLSRFSTIKQIKRKLKINVLKVQLAFYRQSLEELSNREADPGLETYHKSGLVEKESLQDFFLGEIRIGQPLEKSDWRKAG